MAEELKTTIIALLAGGSLNAFGFLVKYILSKRESNANVEETESETRNTDSDTIQKLLDSIGKLSASSAKQRDDINGLKTVQATLIAQNKILVRQNKELVKNNVTLESSMKTLKENNETLSDLVISEQLEKSRLRAGVVELIKQMKEAGIKEPAFKP